ncbi:hypothetical protein [Isoptericola sp. S6320L]|uniref:hypothetical protein n=1 Tax=Isoptericola sp. S6320L TaxID=2926411 RepID=UPI001FF6D37B|nr:hypothetical protein [Isoptericola sp. S6320L]
MRDLAKEAAEAARRADVSLLKQLHSAHAQELADYEQVVSRLKELDKNAGESAATIERVALWVDEESERAASTRDAIRSKLLSSHGTNVAEGPGGRAG